MDLPATSILTRLLMMKLKPILLIRRTGTEMLLPEAITMWIPPGPWSLSTTRPDPRATHRPGMSSQELSR